MRKTFFLVALLACAFVHAQQIEAIRHTLDSAYQRLPFSANVLVVRDGKTVLEKSYGYADYDKKILLAKKHSFQVASISKQFTAYGIMLLNNRCKLNYNDSVSKFIPGFPYHNITIRHLLHHTSGLPEFWDSIRPFLDTMRSNGNPEMIAYLNSHNLALQFEPGSKFDYCDIGYDILANIIERTSGMSYEAFLQKEIFSPLKMKSTHAYMVTDIRQIHNKDLATGHVWDSFSQRYVYAHLRPELNFVFYLGNFYGDGSVVTTAKDLATWMQALKECRLMDCELQNEALVPPSYNGQTVLVRGDLGYGFGWFVRRHPSLGRMIYHSGAHPGNRHYVLRLPDKGITFILLSNTERPGLIDLRGRLIGLLE